MSILIIAEKPSVAREIARIIGAKTRRQGYLEGGGYLVSWAVGHICNISPPDRQDKKWSGTWNFSQLPMIPKKFKLEVNKRTKDQYQVLKKLLTSPEVTEVISATDAGREGELIFRRIYAHSRSVKPVKRLWLSSMTDEAISKAFVELKAASHYDTLGAAAYARAEADWLVGMNGTRAFTIKAGQLLTCGRVQTPVLALLVARRLEIENFKPQPYWEIDAIILGDGVVESFKATWHESPKLKERKISDESKAFEIIKKCLGHPAIVESSKLRKGSSKAPLLYDLTSLQREASSRYGFSAKTTLDIAQKLYEGRKAITYPRTDSSYLSASVFNEIAPHFRAIVPHYGDIIPKVRENFSRDARKFRCVNDKKVTDHHAIIPTSKQIDTSVLSDSESKIYDLICRRFMAAFMPDAKFQSSVAWLNINHEKFKAEGKVFDSLGWLDAEPWRIKQEGALPALAQGQELKVKELNKIAKQTRPPAHYTDASLLRAMETAGRRVDDEELAEALKEKGLGTPATRAAIIEMLITRRSAKREKKKYIMATDRGVKAIEVISALLPILTSAEMTGEWERKLKLIEKNQLSYNDFMKAINAFVAEIVSTLGAAKVDYKPSDNVAGAKNKIINNAEAIGKCPLCGGDVVDKGKAYGCINWKSNQCNFTIWKNAYGGKIAKRAAIELINQGQTTSKMDFYSNKKKTKYQAKLKLDKDKKLVLDFD